MCAADMVAKYGKMAHPLGVQQALGFGAGKHEQTAWERETGSPMWPPPTPGSPKDVVVFESDSPAPHIASRLVRTSHAWGSWGRQ